MLQMGVEPAQIHVMTAISGVSRDEPWEGHVTARFGDHDAPFIGREAFLRNKRATGRLKDLAGAKAISSACSSPITRSAPPCAARR
jgi:hypothetical protein